MSVLSSGDSTKELTGSTALVQSLKTHGVHTIFGLPGVQLDYVFDALYEERESIRVIHPRHEQAAAYMAFGYAQTTGTVGVCMVVPGPGVLNATAALSTAYACNAPVFCITGQIPSHFIGKGLGLLHEIPNQLTAMASVSKWQGHAATVESIPPLVAEAFQQATSGRHRPVVLEIPPDVTTRSAPVRIQAPPDAGSEAGLDEDAIASAASLLGKARNPAIFVGSGIFGAEEELRALAEMLQAPIIMSQHGMGAIDCRHPLAQNMQAGNDLWPQVDVALVVGTRFLIPATEWGRDKDIKLIRVDVDPLQSLSPWAPDVHIVGTAKAALRALVDKTGAHNHPRSSRADQMAEARARALHRVSTALAPQHAYTMAIRRALPEDGIICFGVTQLGFYSWWGFPTYQPRTMIQPGYQGTLGYSFPTALGAQVAYPDRKVVCVVGDGGFMFSVQELATAVHHRINLVTVLFNDNAFGNVRRTQKEAFGGRYISSDLTNPDFMKLADSFGVRGWRVETPAQLEAALREAFEHDGPALIEVAVGEFPNPFPHMPRRKVRG
jgi:acetolactate synthase-1/2/3 large subunit